MQDPIQATTFAPTGEEPKSGAPHVSMSMIKNVWIKQIYFIAAGEQMDEHRHLFDHATLLAAGSVRVTVEGESTDFVAPRVIWIAADKKHQIVSLKPHTVCYCIHAVRNGDGMEDIVDPESVPAGTRHMHTIPGVKPLVR